MSVGVGKGAGVMCSANGTCKPIEESENNSQITSKSAEVARLPPARPVQAAEGANRLPPARAVPAAEEAHRPPARLDPAVNLYEDNNGEIIAGERFRPRIRTRTGICYFHLRQKRNQRRN